MFDEEIVEVALMMADTMFGAQPHASLPVPFDAGALTARVEFHGAFHGSLCATFSESLARLLADAMMRRRPDQSVASDAHDAAGEIVNIMAGNLKVLLPSPCQLSLPHTQATAGPVGSELAEERLGSAFLLLFGEPMWIELTGREVPHGSS